jgi:hypothetical protein
MEHEHLPRAPLRNRYRDGSQQAKTKSPPEQGKSGRTASQKKDPCLQLPSVNPGPKKINKKRLTASIRLDSLANQQPIL